MKLRLTSPPHVVDINGIPGLAYLKEGLVRIDDEAAALNVAPATP